MRDDSDEITNTPIMPMSRPAPSPKRSRFQCEIDGVFGVEQDLQVRWTRIHMGEDAKRRWWEFSPVLIHGQPSCGFTFKNHISSVLQDEKTDGSFEDATEGKQSKQEHGPMDDRWLTTVGDWEERVRGCYIAIAGERSPLEVESEKQKIKSEGPVLENAETSVQPQENRVLRPNRGESHELVPKLAQSCHSASGRRQRSELTLIRGNIV